MFTMWHIRLPITVDIAWPHHLDQRRCLARDTQYLSATCRYLQQEGDSHAGWEWLTSRLRAAFDCGAQVQKRELPHVVNEAARILRYEDYNLSAQALAQRLGVSASYLATQFKAHLDCSIPHYKNWVRIEHVCARMRGTSSTLKDVAADVGFGS